MLRFLSSVFRLKASADQTAQVEELRQALDSARQTVVTNLSVEFYATLTASFRFRCCLTNARVWKVESGAWHSSTL